MRVIAGTFRSRQLKSLKGLALRPTSDRLRETLFNVLGAAVGGSRFLDLFAGTGAIGIEAVSRGAASVVLVENHAPAVRLIRENIASLEISSHTRVISGDVSASLAALAREKAPPFDFVFLDPPYALERQYELVLGVLAESALIAEESIVVAEHRKSVTLAAVFGRLQRVRELRQGDAALSFYRLA